MKGDYYLLWTAQNLCYGFTHTSGLKRRYRHNPVSTSSIPEKKKARTDFFIHGGEKSLRAVLSFTTQTQFFFVQSLLYGKRVYMRCVGALKIRHKSPCLCSDTRGSIALHKLYNIQVTISIRVAFSKLLGCRLPRTVTNACCAQHVTRTCAVYAVQTEAVLVADDACKHKRDL